MIGVVFVRLWVPASKMDLAFENRTAVLFFVVVEEFSLSSFNEVAQCENFIFQNENCLVGGVHCEIIDRINKEQQIP